jgi:hypothetical protein
MPRLDSLRVNGSGIKVAACGARNRQNNPPPTSRTKHSPLPSHACFPDPRRLPRLDCHRPGGTRLQWVLFAPSERLCSDAGWRSLRGHQHSRDHGARVVCDRHELAPLEDPLLPVNARHCYIRMSDYQCINSPRLCIIMHDPTVYNVKQRFNVIQFESLHVMPG